jgi:hypothetical protein
MKSVPMRWIIILLLLLPTAAFGQNFTCRDAAVQQAAEYYRESLALDWLGKKFPNWSKPCPITVRTGPISGQTSFVFHNGEVFGWRMTIQAPNRDKLYKSVLKHEVMHTILATHFRHPLPRALDEGICVWVEDYDPPKWRGKPAAWTWLFKQYEYKNYGSYIYGQGHSVVSYLLKENPDKKVLLNFIAEGHRTKNWPAAQSYQDSQTTKKQTTN